MKHEPMAQSQLTNKTLQRNDCLGEVSSNTTGWGGGGGELPSGDQLLISTEISYHFDHMLQVSNESICILILYTFFDVFPHVYSLRTRTDNPLWPSPDVNRKALSL